MITLSRRFRLAAATLSFTAGFVDALGFIHLGGYFVSFMSGNSTRLAVGVASGVTDALLPLFIIALFVGGVVMGTLVRHKARGSGGTRILIVVSVLLALAAVLAMVGLEWLAIVPIPIAMGAMNTIFQRDGEVSVGVTYMTGTLVKLGQRIAQAFTGGDRWAWASYLLLWTGLVIGAGCGALIYPYFGLTALWIPSGLLLGLALFWMRDAP